MNLNKFSTLLLFLIFPNILFATTWANEFPLYIYGDVSFIATIYEFIKSVVNDGAIETIITVGITITVFIAGFKLKDGDAEGFLKTIIAPITLVALFFTPSVKVHIVDIRVDKGVIDHTLSPDGGYQTVDEVPYAIAFLPASAMLLVNLTVDLIDTNWVSVAAENKLSSNGFQTLSADIRDALQISSLVSYDDANGSRYEYNLKTYLRECILGKALEDNENKQSVYGPKLAYPDNLNPANFVNTSFGAKTVTYEAYDNTIVHSQSCTGAYTTLVSADSASVLAILNKKINKLHPTKDTDTVAMNNAFSEQIGEDTAIKAVGTLKKAVATTVTTRFLQKQQAIDSVGLNGYSIATKLSIDTTLANLRSEGPAKLEWIARTLPDIILIISGLFIAAFPLLIVVQSFMGTGAFMSIANYFMGFFAFYFNFVGLALVQNVISYYTAQKAQEQIVLSMNMPFSAEHLPEFLMQQADMAGMAGMIGAATVVVLTPLIFYGESKGLNSAIGAVSGAFRGNIDATASDTLKQNALEAQIDKELAQEMAGMSEDQASSWLSQEGFNKRANMTSLDTYNQIMRGYSQIGAGMTAQDLVHSGQNSDDYVQGSYLASTQQAMKTAGMGHSIDSVANAGDVAFQDGQVMAESINATHEMRKDYDYDLEAIGTGMAAQQFSKDMGMQYTGSIVGKELDNIAQSRDQIQSNLDERQNAASTAQNDLNNIQSLQQNLNEAKDNLKNAEDEYNTTKNDDTANDFSKDIAQSQLNAAQQDLNDAQNNFNNANDSVENAQVRFENAQVQLNTANQEMQDFNENVKSAGVGDALSSLVAGSVNQSVQQINSGKGLMASGAFNETNGLFNEGNSQAQLLEQGYENQSRIGVNKTMGMGKEILTPDDMLSVQATSQAGMLSEFQEGKTLRGQFGDNLDEKGGYKANDLSKEDKKHNQNVLDDPKSYKDDLTTLTEEAKGKLIKPSSQDRNISFNEMIANEADGKILGRMGGAVAFRDTEEMIGQNAEYGAKSQAFTTDAKIKTQDGIDNAVHVDTVESSIKAATQQNVLDKNLQVAGADGLNDNIDALSKAIDKLASKDGTMAASKTASDIRAIDTAGGHDAFVQLGKDQSSIQTAQSLSSAKAAKDANLLRNDGVTQEGMEAYEIPAGEAASILGVKRDVFFGKDAKKNISNVRKGMKEKGIQAHIRDGKNPKEAEDIMESALNSAGFTEDANGQNVVNALAKMGAMNYASSKTLSAGGVQFNMGVGADGNFRIGEASTQESVKGGKVSSAGHEMKNAKMVLDGLGIEGNDRNAQQYLEIKDRYNDMMNNKDAHIAATGASLFNKEFEKAFGRPLTEEEANRAGLIAGVGTSAAVGWAMSEAGAYVMEKKSPTKQVFKKTGELYNKLTGKSTEQIFDESPQKTSNTNNNENTNGTKNHSAHVNPSENIKSSRDNLTNYNKDLNNVQEKRTKLEESFNNDDRNNKMSPEQKQQRQKEITNLKTQESTLKDNIAKENHNIKANKDYIKYEDAKTTGTTKVTDSIGKVDPGEVKPIHNVNGKTLVDGVDANGQAKTYNANHKTSRESFLKNNKGLHSTLPSSVKQPGWAAKMTKVFEGPGSWKAKLGVAAATTFGMATEGISDYVEAGMNLASAPLALVTPTSLGDGSYIPGPGDKGYTNNNPIKPLTNNQISNSLANMRIQPQSNTIATINPNSGAITPSFVQPTQQSVSMQTPTVMQQQVVSPQVQQTSVPNWLSNTTNSNPFGNNNSFSQTSSSMNTPNSFKTDTTQTMMETTADQNDYLRDMNMSMEDFSDSMMDFIEKNEPNMESR